MKSVRWKSKPTRKQQTPDDLLQALLDFLHRKFYQGHSLQFAKDRPRLLEWVALWPATWLDERGVTVHPDRYREIFEKVFMDSLRFSNAGKITYLPAYLAKVIQSHFAHHGDELYEEAKALRAVSENVTLVLGKLTKSAPDPVRDLAAASRLLKANKKKAPQAPVNDQLTLL